MKVVALFVLLAMRARVAMGIAKTVVRNPTGRFADAGEAWRALAPLL